MGDVQYKGVGFGHFSPNSGCNLNKFSLIGNNNLLLISIPVNINKILNNIFTDRNIRIKK